MDRLLAQWSNSEHCYLSNATIDLWQVGRERAAILWGQRKYPRWPSKKPVCGS